MYSYYYWGLQWHNRIGHTRRWKTKGASPHIIYARAGTWIDSQTFWMIFMFQQDSDLLYTRFGYFLCILKENDSCKETRKGRKLILYVKNMSLLLVSIFHLLWNSSFVLSAFRVKFGLESACIPRVHDALSLQKMVKFRLNRQFQINAWYFLQNLFRKYILWLCNVLHCIMFRR